MTRSAPDPLEGVAARYASATGGHPLFLLEGSDRALFAARWRLPSYRVSSVWAPHHALSYRVSGISSITRFCCGATLRKVPPVGTVTFASGDHSTEWTSDAPIEAIHVYISSDALQRFAEQHLGVAGVPRIQEFFGVRDAWLADYFRLLASECALYDELSGGDPRRPVDSLFLEQTGHLLLRHLVQRHSDLAHAASRALGARVSALPRAVTRRVEDYVEAHLGEDVSLSALAGVAHLSVDHFVRTFRSATGCTPHRFVLDRRLERAAGLLKSGHAPIAKIAHACGFRGAAHFSVKFRARYGMTPSQFRRAS